MTRFADKVVLVTGGTSGIGAAVAERVAIEGGDVFISGRRSDVGRATASRLRARGGNVIFVPADMTVEANVERLVATVVTAYGRLDAAFNNAGTTTPRGNVAQMSSADWTAELTANLTATFLSLKYELTAISPGGSIVNNASIAAVSGTPGLAAYSAAKHGVLGLTRSVALEVADRGIRVNALITGNVDTPLYRELSGVGPTDQLSAAPNPTGRPATASEVASLVAYLLSDETTFMTGTGVTIDGGVTAN